MVWKLGLFVVFVAALASAQLNPPSYSAPGSSSGGCPGGSSGQIQVNDSGVCGGVTGSSAASDGQITLQPTDQVTPALTVIQGALDTTVYSIRSISVDSSTEAFFFTGQGQNGDIALIDTSGDFAGIAVDGGAASFAAHSGDSSTSFSATAGSGVNLGMVSSIGTSIILDPDNGSFWEDASENVLAEIDPSGNVTGASFNQLPYVCGFRCTALGPSWTSGSGAPSSTPTVGSMYSQNDAVFGTSAALWVYTSNGWVAVPGT